MSPTPAPKPVGQTPQTSQSAAQGPSAQARRVQAATAHGSRNATSALGAQLSAVADPNCKHVGYKLGFQDTGRLVLGWIVDGTAIANCYRVQVEKGRAPLMAAAVSGTTQACFGASEINTYTPGTPVVLMLHDKIDLAYILGAAPSILDVAYRGYHDYISQISRKRVDDCHKKYLKMPMGGEVSDLSAWRPIDATLASEWGAVSTTGMRVTLDDFLVQMSVNEFTGVFGFYHDAMLRVSGYNLQTWTGGHERDAYVDQGEYNDYQGYSPYPWEAIGLLKPGTENIVTYTPKTYLCPQGKPYYAHFENKHEYQQPFHRTQQFYGYMGQGQRTVVQAPPEGLDRWTYEPGERGPQGGVYDSDIEADGLDPPQCTPGEDKLRDFPNESTPAIGLHEDNISADGRRFMASAKGIIIAKRMLIPVPARWKRPEAGDGDDTEKNYKAASKLGSGPEHKITGDIKAEDDFPNLQRASGVLDLHAYLFNYAGIHPFFWHTKDYKTWEHTELEYAEVNQRVPDFTMLKGSMYLDLPQPKKLYIDHRYKQQDFYETTAHLSLLDDGSVVIGDGYGAEIRMSGGVLTLSAPGDVWIKSGRNSQIWSGGDAIVRSVGNVDISTTEKSVRIKSEKDVLVLAGNEGGPGGVLIESRSKLQDYDFEKAGDEVRFGGVVLRAPESSVVSLAHQIYMRTGGGGSSIKPGNITIDAGKGEADLVTKSDQLFHYIGQNGQICHFFRASADDDTQKANYFSKDFTLLAGPLSVDKAFFAGGGIIAKGDIVASAGAMVADKGWPFVAPCIGECKTKCEEAIEKCRQFADTIIPDIGDAIDETYLEGLWYDDKQPGNSRVMDIMEFSFRTDEQYKIPDFVLYEDRWQQMARLANKIPERWTEKPVQSQIAGQTYPFPGKKWLQEEDAYATQDFNLVDYRGEGLIDKERGDEGALAGVYRDPEYKTAEKKKINGEYPIIGVIK